MIMLWKAPQTPFAPFERSGEQYRGPACEHLRAFYRGDAELFLTIIFHRVKIFYFVGVW